MPTTKMIQQHLQFIETEDPLFIAYQISNNANGDKWKNIIVLLNGDKTNKEISLPKGKWKLAVDGNTINKKGIQTLQSTVTVPATTAYVLYSL